MDVFLLSLKNGVKMFSYLSKKMYTNEKQGDKMEAIIKELESRKEEIEASVEVVFKTHMKITDWDVPEADDKEAAKILLDMMQAKIDAIRADVEAGKYDNY
jgi:uncharacterized protein YpbB